MKKKKIKEPVTKRLIDEEEELGYLEEFRESIETVRPERLPQVILDQIPHMELTDISASLSVLMSRYKLPSVVSELRRNFWACVDRKNLEGKGSITMSDITGGRITNHIFRKLIKTKGVLAYMLQRPKDELKSIEDILSTGIERIEEVIHKPIMDDKGNVNDKQFNRVMKVLAMLQKREETIHLKFPDRVESKALEKKREMTIKDVKQKEEEYLNNLDISKLEKIPDKEKKEDEELL